MQKLLSLVLLLFQITLKLIKDVFIDFKDKYSKKKISEMKRHLRYFFRTYNILAIMVLTSTAALPTCDYLWGKYVEGNPDALRYVPFDLK